MSETVKLTASDGHELSAYVARPSGAPVAGLVVIQEAFGVNSHIHSVADGYSRDGFLAIAPALFDRIETGVELGYEGEDRNRGIAIARQLNLDNSVQDIDAALAWLHEQKISRSGVIGYCLGGTIAWLSATRLNIDAAVGYYGGNIGNFAQEMPRCPVMLHFGKLDQAHPEGRSGQGAGRAPGRSDFLVRRRSRLQLQRSRQLQPRSRKAGAGAVTGVPQAASCCVAKAFTTETQRRRALHIPVR